MPAISQPQTKIIKTNNAILVLLGKATLQLSGQWHSEVAANQSVMPISFYGGANHHQRSRQNARERYAILSSMIPAKIRKTNTFKKYSKAAYVQKVVLSQLSFSSSSDFRGDIT